MNIVNKVTLAQMKQNKRRTLVTVLGTIISVAMVTAVLAISVSFLNMMINSTIADEGNWHASFAVADRESLESIRRDERWERTSLMQELGYAWREEGQGTNQPYWYVRAYDQTGFADFPFSKLVEGRLPQRAGEAVISAEAIFYGDSAVRVGDTLQLAIGERKGVDEELGEVTYSGPYYGIVRGDDGELAETLEVTRSETYTVVGVVERPFYEYGIMPGYSVVAYLDEENLEANFPLTIYGIFANLHAGSVKEMAEIADAAGLDEYSYNRSLLLYYGVLAGDATRATLYTLTAIVMAIVMIGSVSLIYNAFAISVSERSRYLGMLSSVGATARQKRNSVFFEGLVIGCISIPLGIFFGYLGIGITFGLVHTMLENVFVGDAQLKLVILPSTILLTVIIALAIIFISAFVPALRASRMSTIEAIRQVKDVKLTSRTIKTSRLTRKIFGVEGEIALKNLKRNKRRYQATVFSLIISVVLFLSTGYFGGTLRQSASMIDAQVNFDLLVSVYGLEQSETDAIYKEIQALEGVTESSAVRYFFTGLPEAPTLDATLDGLTIYTLADENLKAYAAQVGADYERLKDPANPAAIIINQATFMQDEHYVTDITLDVKKGDMVPLDLESHGLYRLDDRVETSVLPDQLRLGELAVEATTSDLTLGIMDAGAYRAVAVISEDTLEALQQSVPEGFGLWTVRELHLNADNPRALQKEIEELPQYRSLNIYNIHQYREQQEQFYTFLAVFVYGFVALISAICVANIFNTISTSMMLRKREFAMLRSTGMTPQSFNRMIRFESLFYGLKALLYGLPISLAIMVLIYRSYVNSFEFAFAIPWGHVAVAVIAVFFFVSITMLYSTAKIKRENIIDSLKQEAI